MARLDDCLACGPRGSGCFVATGDDFKPISISASVGGAGGVNRPADVRIIQQALNEVGIEEGGAEPPLTVDGICGSRTRAAILAFQRKQVTIVDDRVDVNNATLAALNRVLAADDDEAAPSARRTATFFPPDPELVAKIISLVPQIRIAIRAAIFHCTVASPFIHTHKIEQPKGPFQANVRQSLNMLEVFSLSKMRNPRPSFDNIRLVYHNMEIALNRSFETNPLIAPALFVPNTSRVMEIEAAAFTSAGGAYKDGKRRMKKSRLPNNRIYLCHNLAAEETISQILVAIHELAHYVSGKPIFIHDPVKKGRMLNRADKPSFDAIRPEQKVASAEHYGFFAVLAGFRRFDLI